MRIRQSVGTAASLAGALLVTTVFVSGTSPAAQAATMSAAPQGASRTVSMEDA